MRWGLTAILILGAGIASGCSITGFGPDVEPTTTGSLLPSQGVQSVQETVDPSDWEVVRTTLVSALADETSVLPLEWENELTGTVGTIIPMEFVALDEGQTCRRFSTTLNGIGGVQQYRGDACKSEAGQVELIGLEPHNAVVDAIQLEAPEEPQVQ